MALKIEQRIGVAAPVDDVWDMIADIPSWPQWSPIHRTAEGAPHFGAPVHLEEYYEGLGVWEVHGVVDDWTPLSHLHISVPKPFYAGKLVRYFEMEPLTETGSTFTVGALFSGYMSVREGKAYREFLQRGFSSFAEALKVRAETQFAAHPEVRAKVAPEVPVKPQLGPSRPNWTPNRFLFFGGGKKK